MIKGGAQLRANLKFFAYWVKAQEGERLCRCTAQHSTSYETKKHVHTNLLMTMNTQAHIHPCSERYFVLPRLVCVNKELDIPLSRGVERQDAIEKPWAWSKLCSTLSQVTG